MQTTKILYIICKTVGFGLLFLSWIKSGGATGIFPLMTLIIMTTLRYRIPKLRYTIVIDGIVLLFLEQYLVFSVFVICEVFYRAWDGERIRGLKLRDAEANKYYELERLQCELLASAAQVERLTAVAERARIARDIHDNAGHEIVAAYISLQTARMMMTDSENADALELYDTALERLNNGVNKIREAVHNLSAVAFVGVDGLREKCRNFSLSVCEVKFNAYGDTSRIPVYVWSVLDSCLNESLTNISRHSAANSVSVDLDATSNIVRLCIENDGGAGKNTGVAGIGLRNLRHRAAAIGGSLSVDAGEIFRVICVIPIHDIT